MKLVLDEVLPLRDVVFNALRESILHGELQPGERLIEVSISKQLGVSRTPVREAIHKLEQEGLVVMNPRRGAQVASISEKNVYDVLEVRQALEELAVELAVQRAVPQDKIHLRQAETEFASCITNPNLAVIAQKDESFHDVIYEATKNKRLQQLISNLREQMYRFRLEYIKDSSHRKLLVEEHHLITEAIIRGDAQTAKLVSGRHIENQQKTIVKNLSAQETSEKEKKSRKDR